ncbi:hypothetical protein GOV09_04100 [Candidatus Woesearchaeota archaeon]|nr:hypothetical protein [Candidatus Woesearchaeota archaeon]
MKKIIYLGLFILLFSFVSAECLDSDNDGFTTCKNDCNDQDALINPAATELCGDGIDNDCNTQIDENCPPEETFIESCGNLVLEPEKGEECEVKEHCIEDIEQRDLYICTRCECWLLVDDEPPVRDPQDPEGPPGAVCTNHVANYNIGGGNFRMQQCCSVDRNAPCSNPDEVCMPSATACIGGGRVPGNCGTCVPKNTAKMMEA